RALRCDRDRSGSGVGSGVPGGAHARSARAPEGLPQPHCQRVRSPRRLGPAHPGDLVRGRLRYDHGDDRGHRGGHERRDDLAGVRPLLHDQARRDRARHVDRALGRPAPRGRAQPPEPARARHARAGATAGRGAVKTNTSAVLVVDDEKTIADGLRLTLESEGYAVHTTGSVRDALAAFAQFEAEAAIVDLMVADADANVLIIGESGTGKELVADALHERSRRRGGPWVKINCAALPKDLIESELFGHTRGAFTGATSDKTGLLEEADGGSLLLDEITEMPAELQAKLLRVLEERAVRRVGAAKAVPVDFRLISSTNRSPEAALREGRLRQDLFFRINTVSIDVPPLRERREDIPILVRAFLERYRAKHGIPHRRP